jgi:hypothetical protein
MNHLRRVQVGKGGGKGKQKCKPKCKPKWPEAEVYEKWEMEGLTRAQIQEAERLGVPLNGDLDAWDVYALVEEKKSRLHNALVTLKAHLATKPKKGGRSHRKKGRATRKKGATRKTRRTRLRVKSKVGGSKPGFHPGVKNNVAKYASYDIPDVYSSRSKGLDVNVSDKYYTYTKDGNDKYGITA